MDYSPAISSVSSSETTIQENSQILWKQLLSLATLYASVIIGWIAYYNYQPILLETYNFTDLTLFLFIVQGIIMVIAPPIAGRLGDKFRVKAGKRNQKDLLPTSPSRPPNTHIHTDKETDRQTYRRAD